jgi:hypothetical protein
MNADKDFVFNLRSSAFIGGWDFFTASQGADAQSLMMLCLNVKPASEHQA